MTIKSVTTALALALAVGGAGCGSSGSSERADPPPTAAAADRPPPTHPGTEIDLGEQFASNATFATPFEFVKPTWLATGSTIEGPNLVTWEPMPLGSPTVRFLAPVTVYPPGGAVAPAPAEAADYLSYLLGQADHGAVFQDMVETSVDGHPATLVSATSPGAVLDGSLGCPSEGVPAEECYGLNPVVDLRIAVVDVDGTPLVAWLRHDLQSLADPAAEFAAFEDLLDTVRFR
jgi:hypothetical protein